MLRPRVIPALLLHEKALVKTTRFGKFEYIGDPANTVRIFNELEVDELCFLDISAARSRKSPNFEVLREIATERFMPLSYGGGITSFDTAKRIYDTGFEKVIVNSAAWDDPTLVDEIARVYGTQAVVAAIDVGRTWTGATALMSRGKARRERRDVIVWAQEMARRGAGEILLTAVEREGTWEGFDLDLVSRVAQAVEVPVIAHGGAGKLDDIGAALQAGASAVALGSFVVFQKKGMGVLVNFPGPDVLAAQFPRTGGEI